MVSFKILEHQREWRKYFNAFEMRIYTKDEQSKVGDVNVENQKTVCTKA